MLHEKAKLVGYAVAGVLVACLALASVVIPLHKSPKVLLSVSLGGADEPRLLRLEGTEGTVYECGLSNPPPLATILNVTLYEFSRPLGVGSEADIVVSVTSTLNESEPFFIAGWIGAFEVESGSAILPSGKLAPRGLTFVNESARWVWTGNIDANGARTFNLRLRATEISVGNLVIVASRMKILDYSTDEILDWFQWDPEYIFPLKYVGIIAEFDFVVLRDNILVRSLALPVIEIDGKLEYAPRFGMKLSTWPSVESSPPYNIEMEFNGTIRIDSYTSSGTDVTMRLFLDRGIALIEGQTTWTGNITTIPHTVITLPMKIRFVEVGTWYMYCYVEKEGLIIGGPRMMQFKVTNENVTWRPMPPG